MALTTLILFNTYLETLNKGTDLKMGACLTNEGRWITLAREMSPRRIGLFLLTKTQKKFNYIRRYL